MRGANRVRRLGRVLVASALLTATAGLTAAAPPCDLELLARAEPGALGYQRRDDGDVRCEGLLEEPRATKEGLELVSLVRGKLEYDPGRHRSLRIASPDLSGLTAEPVRVQAFSLQEGDHYRMDAVLPRGRPMIWPITSVLAPGGLGSDRIGVYGMVGTGDHLAFVALGIAVDGADPDLTAPIRMTLRTPVDLKRILWRYAGETEDWPPFKGVPRSDIAAGQWITLEIPAGVSEVVRVQVQGTPVFHKHAVWLNRSGSVRIIRRSP